MPRAIELRISPDTFVLLEPDLHDGSLDGISILGENTIELSVSEPEGDKYRIILKDIAEFHATDFRAGSIIFDVTIRRGGDVRIADLAWLESKGNGYGPSYRESDLGRMHEKVVSGDLYLVSLSTSYGCGLSGISGHVAILQRSEAGIGPRAATQYDR